MDKLRRPGVIVLLICAVVMATGIVAVAIYFMQKSPYEISKALRQEVGFDIILPSQIPSGSKVTEQPEYDGETDLLTTKIQLDASSIIFSQQNNPGVDLKQVDAQDTYLVNAGAVYILKGEKGRLQAIVETPDSWLMVNADDRIENQNFKKLLESLDTI